MPIVTREFQIIYGNLTIGAGTNYIIDGTDPFRLTKGYENASVEATIIVTGDTEANFNSSCDTLEAAFRVPRQRLRVILGSTTMWDYNPAVGASTNTGFNAVPTISKPGSRHDTGRSRRYQISVSVTLPADLSGQNGRLTSTVNLTETDARRRRLIITGVYTAMGSRNARDQYQDNIDAYASAVYGAFGGTWEGPFDIRAESDDTDKVLNFSRTYEELIFNQAVGTLDDTRIRRQSLLVNRVIEAPGDSLSSTQRLTTVVAKYTAAIDKTVSQDLSGIYTAAIKPWLLECIRQTAGASSQALVNEEIDFDRAENAIAANLVMLTVGGSGILSSSLTVEDAVDYGATLIPCWSGDQMSKYLFKGPASMIRTITKVTRELGKGTSSNAVGTDSVDGGGGGLFGDSIFSINQPIFIDVGEDFGLFNIGGGGGGRLDPISKLGDEVEPEPKTSPGGGRLVSVPISQTVRSMPVILGRLGDPQIKVTDRTVITVKAFYVTPPSNGGGGSYGGGPRTQQR